MDKRVRSDRLTTGLEAQECSTEWDLHLQGQIIPSTLEEGVRHLLELKDDIARNLAWLLLRLIPGRVYCLLRANEVAGTACRLVNGGSRQHAAGRHR